VVTVEYVVAGPLLAIIGATQIWLKRGDASRAARHPGAAGSVSTSVLAAASDHDAGEAEDPPAAQAPADAAEARKPPLWDLWTGILGYVAVALGIVVLVVGLLGK
jgi:hypothetical protein